uniref:Uncharacterized protein n=1 Tax=Cannabis sativa TaxID=3483 RepID=A0A803QMH8_CANSA
MPWQHLRETPYQFGSDGEGFATEDFSTIGELRDVGDGFVVVAGVSPAATDGGAFSENVNVDVGDSRSLRTPPPPLVLFHVADSINTLLWEDDVVLSISGTKLGLSNEPSFGFEPSAFPLSHVA